MIEAAAEAGRTVRAVGAGHAFSDVVLTDGTLVSLERMCRVLGVDRARGLVRVEAGVTLHNLMSELDDYGLALENLGDVDEQSLAGATATDTHGTAPRLPNLSAALETIELVLANGSVAEFSAKNDPDAWRAARVSIGALGVVTAVTLRAVPAFTLEAVEETAPLDDALDRLDELADGSEHFELYTFPHSPLALTRMNNRVDEPPRPPWAARLWFEDVFRRNHVVGLACRIGRRRPSLIPAINQKLSRSSVRRRRIDRSYRVLSSPRRVRFTETEYAIPRTNAAEAVRAIRTAVNRHDFAVPFPLGVRFAPPDDAFLSPATGRETCYIAARMYKGMEWEPYFRAVEEIMDAFSGRPHWGTRHFQTAATLRPRYPEWDRFAAVRARLDPGGRFANDYVRRVLDEGGS